jgi:phenylpyruvate tautomerase PptA (4-oxalocrotonate tautomerase family)
MPVYHCSIPETQLDDAKRQQIASEITRIHCEKTGAPPDFAHVLFADAAAAGAAASVVGSIRAGRSASLRDEMAGAMAAAVAKSLGVEAGIVRVLLLEVPASWVMEGGAVMPEPGDEAAWLARHGQA